MNDCPVLDRYIGDVVGTLLVPGTPLSKLTGETQHHTFADTTTTKAIILPPKKRGGHSNRDYRDIRTARKTIAYKAYKPRNGDRIGAQSAHVAPAQQAIRKPTTRASTATASRKHEGEEECGAIAEMLPAKEMMPHLLSPVSEEWPMYDKLAKSGEYMVFPNLLVYVRTSDHVGVGLGVYVHSFVPEGMTIPVPGRIVDNNNDSANVIQLPEWGGDYAWEIASNVAVGKINDFKGFKTHDDADRQRLHLKKNSIFKFDHHGLLWLEIIKDVEANTELITDYGRNHFSAAMNKMHSRWFRESTPW